MSNYIKCNIPFLLKINTILYTIIAMKSLFSKIIILVVSLLFVWSTNIQSFAIGENHNEYATNNVTQEHIEAQDCGWGDCGGCDSEELCCGSELNCFANCEYKWEIIWPSINPPKFDYTNTNHDRVYLPLSFLLSESNTNTKIQKSKLYIHYQESQFPQFLVGIIILVI